MHSCVCVSVCLSLCAYVRVGVCHLEGLSLSYTCFLLLVMMKKHRNSKGAPHGDAIFFKSFKDASHESAIFEEETTKC